MFLFLIMQTVSFLYNYFPRICGRGAHLHGVMHIVITFAIVPLTILAPIFIGTGSGGSKRQKFRDILSRRMHRVILRRRRRSSSSPTSCRISASWSASASERSSFWTFLTALKLVRTDTALLPQICEALRRQHKKMLAVRLPFVKQH
jgi:hypothetical protein